ncbi:cupin domain-containing protein [Chengkuizengella sediminis]|nr:cupin domain-containing protein [Chengkuizengella sediminis]
MEPLIREDVINLAEKFQFSERVFNMEDLPWVPFDDGNSYFKPLRFDLNTGTWTYLFKIKPNKVLARHRHTGGSVIGYTLAGEWRYAERDWIAKPGTFIFEPPGDIHTFITLDEEVVSLFILGGTLQYFDDDNTIIGQDDVYTVLHKYRSHCNENNLEVCEDLIY